MDGFKMTRTNSIRNYDGIAAWRSNPALRKVEGKQLIRRQIRVKRV